jgi:phosphoglycolate phosphatase
MPLVLPPVKGIVFDFDGTLAETNIDFAGIRAALRGFFIEQGVWDEPYHQRYILEMVDAVCSDLPEAGAREMRRAAMAIVREAEGRACRNARLYRGVSEALTELEARGYRLGIFTRNSRECCEMILRRHPFPHSALLAREDVPRVKPDPDHLLRVLARLDCPPEQAAVVGDHHTDVETAKAVGAWPVGVLTTTGTREAFIEAGAVLVLDSVADLPAHLP